MPVPHKPSNANWKSYDSEKRGSQTRAYAYAHTNNDIFGEMSRAPLGEGTPKYKNSQTWYLPQKS